MTPVYVHENPRAKSPYSRLNMHSVGRPHSRNTEAAAPSVELSATVVTCRRSTNEWSRIALQTAAQLASETVKVACTGDRPRARACVGK